MVVAGKNSKKIDYVLEAVKAGLNVYADKPLVIDPEGFEKLKEAFRIANEKGVVDLRYHDRAFRIYNGPTKIVFYPARCFWEIGRRESR